MENGGWQIVDEKWQALLAYEADFMKNRLLNVSKLFSFFNDSDQLNQSKFLSFSVSSSPRRILFTDVILFENKCVLQKLEELIVDRHPVHVSIEGNFKVGDQ